MKNRERQFVRLLTAAFGEPRLWRENPRCEPGDECEQIMLRRDVAISFEGPRPCREAGGPRRREAKAGFSGTTAVKPWGSILYARKK